MKVIRSISDVVESTLYRETQGILKTSKLVRNYYQRRVMFRQEPEVREASPERFDDEEEDDGSSGSDDSPFNKRGHKTFLRGSFERMPVDAKGSSPMRAHNHRSVIRPRDVKHKKNKCWKPPDGCGNDAREFPPSFSM